ncbi:type II toxin-antitoxin system PemK/MazF family toxin [Clostridium butyricum]|uniref:type II toxin-antitoxin system PemK/MazF family toxin n=1 Tax=Clostridium butyricum TaxID=1492 RepID=UPI0032C11C98
MDVELSRVQQYLEWMKTKLFLDKKAKNAKEPSIRFVRRGQVYECSFGVGIGSEQEKENRPCVILQNYNGNRNSPNTIVAPISHTDDKLPVIVELETQYNSDGTVKLDGSVLLANVITISKARLGNLITDLGSEEMKKIDLALAKSIDIHKYYLDISKQLDKKKEYIVNLKKERNSAQDDLKKILNLLQVTSLEEAEEKIKNL